MRWVSIQLSGTHHCFLVVKHFVLYKAKLLAGVATTE